MDFFRKILGSSRAEAPKPSVAAEAAEMIEFVDAYGRRYEMTPEQWRTDVLPANLKSKWDDADALYSMIVGALRDGFIADVVDAALRLSEIDSIHSRGATALAIVQMKSGRLDEAEKTLTAYLKNRGDEGVVLTNLAKVHAERGDHAQAVAVLRRALEVDRNQDNAFDWYVAIERERSGDDAVEAAFRWLSTLPLSWRADLWLARRALERGDRATALGHYDKALATTDRVPEDALTMMSGDLGNHGMLREIVDLVAPRFRPEEHGRGCPARC